MAEYPGAIDYFVDPSRVFVGQNSCEVLVLHGTGGQNPDQTAQELGDYFRTNSFVTSVHYGIDRSGAIAQYVHEADGSGGNCCVEAGYDPFWQPYLSKYGNLNLCTLSIEHENNLDNSLPLTDAQKQTSFKLVSYLCQKYHLDYSHIKTHASIAPINRAHCPGNYPLADLQTYLQGGNMSGIPAGWTDDGTTLIAPNKHKVVHGFRNYILNNSWDSNDWPLEEEHAQSPLEITNAALGAGTQQMFRFHMLGWTPGTGVISEWLGVELLATRQLLASQPSYQSILSALKTIDASLQSSDASLQALMKQLSPS